MKSRYDVAIVGAGIAGLAHAYIAAKLGKSVLVLEKSSKASGASIRNFGMIWPVGQPASSREIAVRSREIWVEMLTELGIWHDPVGCLHLAHHDDEFEVLREFNSLGADLGYSTEILTAGETVSRFPISNPAGLKGSLFSASEVCVFSPDVIRSLPGRLVAAYGVDFEFDTAVTQIAENELVAQGQTVGFDRAIVCPGDDIRTLFPGLLSDVDLVPCKLQMMRSVPTPHIGTMFAGGLTLLHYANFKICPSLPSVRERIESTMPDYVKYGIHVMVSQHSDGRWTIGDSHEYGLAIEPFDKQEIDQLILDYLAQMVVEVPKIEAHWNGVYLKRMDGPVVVRDPLPSVTVVTGLGGAGMTMSFGIAEKVIREGYKNG